MKTAFTYEIWAKMTHFGEKQAICSVFVATDVKKAAIIARAITSRLKDTGLHSFRLRKGGKALKGFGFVANK